MDGAFEKNELLGALDTFSTPKMEFKIDAAPISLKSELLFTLNGSVSGATIPVGANFPARELERPYASMSSGWTKSSLQ